MLAALPRSGHHLSLLAANDTRPDLLLYRDAALRPLVEHKYADRAVFLGREARPGRSPAALLAARRANAAYYRQIAEICAARPVDRLILFLEGEPLERFLLTRWCDATVELWEDGLSHYVDLTGRAWYAARGLVQALAGFYPRDITRRRLDRQRVLVRDRFDAGDLSLPFPPLPATRDPRPLLIGSPLVEDGLIGRWGLSRALARLAAALDRPIAYFPHPREDRVRLAADIRAAGPAVELVADDAGLLDYATRVDHALYVSALSTGLLDIGRFARSAFVPGWFGLHRAHRALAGWPKCPVPVPATPAALRRFVVQALA